MQKKIKFKCTVFCKVNEKPRVYESNELEITFKEKRNIIEKDAPFCPAKFKKREKKSYKLCSDNLIFLLLAVL